MLKSVLVTCTPFLTAFDIGSTAMAQFKYPTIDELEKFESSYAGPQTKALEELRRRESFTYLRPSK